MIGAHPLWLGSFGTASGLALPASTVFYAQFLGADNSTALTEHTGKTLLRLHNPGSGTPLSPCISTAQSHFPASSLYLDGDAYVQCNHVALNLDNSDYTLACWFYLDFASWSGKEPQTLLHTFYDQTQGRTGLYVNTNGAISGGEQDAYGANDASLTSAPGLVSLRTWHYVALVKSGNTLRIFLDDNPMPVATASTITRTNQSSTLRIGTITGAKYDYGFFMNGYMQHVIMCKSAVYSAPFTKPDAPWVT